ncbi:MAG: hypothetical protein R3214_08375 [Christiangramia sp.]|nr:hypothetical protein [Christiangramia sp.]
MSNKNEREFMKKLRDRSFTRDISVYFSIILFVLFVSIMFVY